MDPLSMTASIIAILQLTSTLTNYINNVRKATAEQAKVAVEASNLFSLLTSMRFRVEGTRSDDPWFNQVKMLGTYNGPLDQLRETLEEMVETISSSRKRDQIKSALMWKFTKSQVDEMLQRMERLKSLITCALANDLLALSQMIHGDVVALAERTEQLHLRTGRLETHAHQETRRRLSQWLGLPDPSTNYHAALEKRHLETGLWLLDSQLFNEWKTSTSSLMWLHGNAGCGKTVLSAALLQNIIQHTAVQSDAGVAYFYFDFNDIEKQSSKKAVRSLLFQVALLQHDHLHRLEELYQKCDNGQKQPAEDVIRSLLRDATADAGNIYIVLDALDECADREKLLTLLDELITSKQPSLHVLATSRREKDIEDQLSRIARYNVNIESAVVDEDIRVYVRDRLDTDARLKKWPAAVQEEITNVMMEKANGMFRWAYCQLESIRCCIKLSALRKALSSLPKTLDETYDRILLGLESTGQLDDAVTALQWLCYSTRPLQLLEIRDVLAIVVEGDGGFYPEDRLPDPFDIMVVCSSLISCIEDRSGNDHAIDSGSSSNEAYDDSDDADSISGNDHATDTGSISNEAHNGNVGVESMTQVRLAHFSVQEFLLSDRCRLRSDFQMQTCHRVMAEGCLHYLLYLGEKGPLTQEIVDHHPLARYAAQSWWRHAQKVESTRDCAILDLVLRLLTNGNATLLWVQLYNIDEPQEDVDLSRTISDVSPSLYYAALIGLPEVVERVLDAGANVDAEGGIYSNALQAASVKGHEKVVQILLDAGANVNAIGGEFFNNALQAASSCGHGKLVQMLLDAGAYVNAIGGFYANALQVASYRGYEKVVQILLHAGADVNAVGGQDGNALQAASGGGHEKVVQMLLDAGADVNAVGGFYGNALAAASDRGYEKVVQLLLHAGADVNAIGGGYYGNALYAASTEGYEKVVQILLHAGADVNAIEGDYGNALRAASNYGHEKVVQILLDAGADVNAVGGMYGSALHDASREGHEKVVQMLLNAGAHVNAVGGGYYGNALQAASKEGHEKVVQILLHAGADVNVIGGVFGTALHAASSKGYEEVVQMLLDAGADVNAIGGEYGNALQATSREGHEKVVQMLLDAGADVNAIGEYYGSALHAASKGGHEKVVQILIDWDRTKSKECYDRTSREGR